MSSQNIISIHDITASAGWLFFTIKISNQEFKVAFSYVFDPLLDFKHWLEAIAIGVQQTTFNFNPEGPKTLFNFEKISWDTEQLTISSTFDDDVEFYIRANIDRKQLVRAFYFGIIDFSQSSKYDPKQWERVYQKGHIDNNSGYSGLPLAKFYSPIIENYLK